ncbi:hypothetical protein ES705_14329 [subsurface metagenome]
MRNRGKGNTWTRPFQKTIKSKQEYEYTWKIYRMQGYLRKLYIVKEDIEAASEIEAVAKMKRRHKNIEDISIMAVLVRHSAPKLEG